ncbi:hypothetical protein T10_10804 [Trichinella papuae]|uniref:Secreted protein n=1 Tax=Trichinella papuae TaxID=268474 RepID=A0A0V1N290_9BILA|nr:hypothetical protein T10_10804 [Trichinella papuae]
MWLAADLISPVPLCAILALAIFSIECTSSSVLPTESMSSQRETCNFPITQLRSVVRDARKIVTNNTRSSNSRFPQTVLTLRDIILSLLFAIDRYHLIGNKTSSLPHKVTKHHTLLWIKSFNLTDLDHV